MYIQELIVVTSENDGGPFAGLSWIIAARADEGAVTGVMGHANMATTRRLYAADWCEADERNEIVLAPARRRRDRPVSFDPHPFIERAGWTFASSVADRESWQHWYVVESQHADDPDFRRFAELIEAQGYRARFEGATYRYLRVGDFLYWTSRSLWTPGQNINRRPVAEVEGQPEHEQATLPI